DWAEDLGIADVILVKKSSDHQTEVLVLFQMVCHRTPNAAGANDENVPDSEAHRCSSLDDPALHYPPEDQTASAENRAVDHHQAGNGLYSRQVNGCGEK